MMTLKTCFFLMICSVLPSAIFFAPIPATTPVSANREDDRASDQAAIRAHIESIFQAFINKDGQKLRATHSTDWRGFLEGSPVAIRGIEEYMRAVDGGLKNPNGGMSGYRIADYDVIFHGDLAVVCFVADVELRSGNASKLRILDVYAKRNGEWIQAGSHTTVHPDAIAKQISNPVTVSPQMRKAILDAREAVWRAYFTNDRAALERLIPEEAIAINDGSEKWADRAAILDGAERFARSGAKLARLEFPRTEMQVYGNTVIIYTTYLYEIEANGQRRAVTGRGTEIFVRRNNTLVNTGWHLDDGK
ncbi:MAG: nuclear transport factor 2 family protein [Acidobacteriota bacterium]